MTDKPTTIFLASGKPVDFPYAECMERANDLAKHGCIIVQKWTCDGCERRISGAEGAWTETGVCDHCGAVTNMVEKGCNYMVLAPTAEAQAALLKHMGH